MIWLNFYLNGLAVRFCGLGVALAININEQYEYGCFVVNWSNYNIEGAVDREIDQFPRHFQCGVFLWRPFRAVDEVAPTQTSAF